MYTTIRLGHLLIHSRSGTALVRFWFSGIGVQKIRIPGLFRVTRSTRISEFMQAYEISMAWITTAR